MARDDRLRALVIFDTRFGNTARVAEALARGLGRAPGIVADVAFVPEAHIGRLQDVDLLVVGGPTEHLRESPHLRHFFQEIGGYDLHDKFGFAFDTHPSGAFHGSAAHTIETQLRQLGVEILRPRTSATTLPGPASPLSAGPGGSPMHLAPGTEAHFLEIGRSLGESLTAAVERRRMDRARASASGAPETTAGTPS